MNMHPYIQNPQRDIYCSTVIATASKSYQNNVHNYEGSDFDGD